MKSLAQKSFTRVVDQKAPGQSVKYVHIKKKRTQHNYIIYTISKPAILFLIHSAMPYVGKQQVNSEQTPIDIKTSTSEMKMRTEKNRTCSVFSVHQHKAIATNKCNLHKHCGSQTNTFTFMHEIYIIVLFVMLPMLLLSLFQKLFSSIVSTKSLALGLESIEDMQKVFFISRHGYILLLIFLLPHPA